MYLNDACDEEDAETSCEAAAAEALSLVTSLETAGEATIAEPYVTCASLRLSQCRPEEAAELLTRAMGVISRATEEGRPDDAPPFDVRKAASKLLMEVGLPQEAWGLLQTLHVEAEDDLEVRISRLTLTLTLTPNPTP